VKKKGGKSAVIKKKVNLPRSMQLLLENEIEINCNFTSTTGLDVMMTGKQLTGVFCSFVLPTVP
jgi:hypothetical protein